MKYAHKISFRSNSLQNGRKKFKSLNSQKPMGPSSIAPLGVKDGCDVIVEHLTNVIISFTIEKNFPNKLETAYVTPLFKKDDPDNPENYRPISVTSSISNFFERLLQK